MFCKLCLTDHLRTENCDGRTVDEIEGTPEDYVSLLAERDRLREINRGLVAALSGARTAVEDYISRIEKHGFQPSFGRGVLREIDAALAKAETGNSTVSPATVESR